MYLFSAEAPPASYHTDDASQQSLLLGDSHKSVVPLIG